MDVSHFNCTCLCGLGASACNGERENLGAVLWRTPRNQRKSRNHQTLRTHHQALSTHAVLCCEKGCKIARHIVRERTPFTPLFFIRVAIFHADRLLLGLPAGHVDRTRWPKQGCRLSPCRCLRRLGGVQPQCHRALTSSNTLRFQEGQK